MSFWDWLGFDMSGRFSALKRKYDRGSIDETAVHCHITRWGNGEISFSASAEIIALNWSTVGVVGHISFYSVGRFHSVVEAFSHEEAEIRKATKKHPKTRFYRYRVVNVVENGKLSEQEVIIPEFCLNGAWHHAEEV